jgi:Rod binding domain-containing protein
MNSNLDPSLAADVAQQTDLNRQQRLVEQNRRALAGAPAQDQEAKLRESCEGFEAIFIQKMWEQMQATVNKEGNILYSREERLWQSMYDQELSKKMASSGGIGLADMMMEQLGRNLRDASRTTAADAQRRREPFPIKPAPLMPVYERGAQTQKTAALEASSGAVPDLYSGEAPLVSGAKEDGSPEDKLAAVMSEIEADMLGESGQSGYGEMARVVPASEFDALVGRIENGEGQEDQIQAPIITRTIYQTNMPPKSKNKKARVSNSIPINGRTPRSAVISQINAPLPNNAQAAAHMP